MKKVTFTIRLFIVFLFNSYLNAQSYYYPTHYQGIFHGQPSSARATGMGLTTITLDGIENALYNPATIGVSEKKLNVHINYASGSQVYKAGKYPFIGASYRINDKLVVGASMLSWIDEKNSPWTTIIGTFDESVERRSQAVYNLVASYEVIPNLQIGVSGNYLVGKSVGNTVTNSEFILSLGAVYDLQVDWIALEEVKNQKIRFAGSLVNALMKNRIEERYEDFLNYRDLPIHLTFGTSYSLTMPFAKNFTSKNSIINEAPREVDLSLHLQYRDVLKGPDDTVVNINHQNNSAFGIGAEAWFMDLVALRMGYYNEKRPSGSEQGSDFWATDNKHGFTWGFGVNVPWNKLSNGKVPFNSEINFVTSRLLNEYNKNFTPPSYFTDRNFLFAIGISLKWVND